MPVALEEVAPLLFFRLGLFAALLAGCGRRRHVDAHHIVIVLLLLVNARAGLDRQALGALACPLRRCLGGSRCIGVRVLALGAAARAILGWRGRRGLLLLRLLLLLGILTRTLSLLALGKLLMRLGQEKEAVGGVVLRVLNVDGIVLLAVVAVGMSLGRTLAGSLGLSVAIVLTRHV